MKKRREFFIGLAHKLGFDHMQSSSWLNLTRADVIANKVDAIAYFESYKLNIVVLKREKDSWNTIAPSKKL